MTLVGLAQPLSPLVCPARHHLQLFKNKDLVGHLFDEQMEYQSNFFNWMMSDVEGVASFVKAFAGNTLSPGDIVRDESREWRTGPLQVGNHRIWVWHGKKCMDTSDEDFLAVLPRNMLTF